MSNPKTKFTLTVEIDEDDNINYCFDYDEGSLKRHEILGLIEMWKIKTFSKA